MRLLLISALSILASISYADVTDLRITEVNPATGQVEVTNTSIDPLVLGASLPFSHKSNTASVIPSGTVFGPGEELVFNVTGLDAADSDLWLYKDSDFGNAASIISGLKWGAAANVGRTGIAVIAGIWPSTSAFVPAQINPSLSLRAVAYNTTIPSNWAEGTSNFGAFYGTGTPILAPLPDIAVSQMRVELENIATGMASPLTIADPDDGTNRIFISDQIGLLRVVENGTLLPTPMLDVTGRLVSNPITGEMGLIGFAIHPKFATTKKLYTLTSETRIDGAADFPTSGTARHHQGVVAEWQIDAGNPNLVNVTSRREIMRIDEPQSNHNGGVMRFGPDGNLYIALGDGGGRDDEPDGHVTGVGNGQSLSNVLGKILRIQVDGGPFPNGKYGIPADNPFVAPHPGLDEIWVYGLRNPYSFSFDSLTGDCYVGDVGQGEIEELDLVTTGSNCGWRLKEGSFFFDPAGSSAGGLRTIPVAPLPTNLLDPLVEYDHGDGVSIIGGFVYRGSAIPGLAGRYVFGEYLSRLFVLTEQNEINELKLGAAGTQPTFRIKGFGEDRNGEIYACGSPSGTVAGTSGVVAKIVLQSPVDDWQIY